MDWSKLEPSGEKKKKRDGMDVTDLGQSATTGQEGETEVDGQSTATERKGSEESLWADPTERYRGTRGEVGARLRGVGVVFPP